MVGVREMTRAGVGERQRQLFTRGQAKWIRRGMLVGVIWLLGTALFVVGARARQWTWVLTEEIRFYPNINNAYFWGVRVNHDAQGTADAFREKKSTWGEFFWGYKRIYAREWESPSLRAMSLLDYPPMRLLTVALWARSVEGPPEGGELKAWMRGAFWGGPPSGVWRWEDAAGILGFNTFCAGAAAVGAVFLVRYWVGRGRGAYRGGSAKTQATGAQLVDSDLSSHPNPGAREKKAPADLTGAIAWCFGEEKVGGKEGGASIASGRAGWRGWIYGVIAGVLIWVNPAVLVDGHGWPQWDIWAVPFYIWAGLAASTGWWFAAGALLATGAMFKAQLMMVGPVILIWGMGMGIRPTLRFLLGFSFAGLVITSMWLLPDARAWAWFLAWVGAAIVVAVGWRVWKGKRARGLGYWMALVVCVGIGAGCYWFDGSFDWLRVGFLNPTEGHPALSMGATNLPAVLQGRYGWGLNDEVWGNSVTIRDLLRAIYGLTLVLCGVAAAIQARRGSARVLLALVAPWVLLYALMPQLHERHVLWAAAISAIGVGVSLDYLWLHWVVTFMGVMGILAHMLPRNAGVAPRLLKFVNGLSPDFGWVMVLVAGIYFWQAWKIRRKSGRRA